MTQFIGSAEADRQTLNALRDAGSDLTKPTDVNAYLYFEDREAAERAAADANTPEMTATVQRAADDSAWLCLVTGTMVPSETAIRALSIRLLAVASAHSGEYDGWEAAVVA
jgi:regulator of RNase E activity RraB